MGPYQVLSLQVKGILDIPQSSRTEASPSDDLVSYLAHSQGASYPSAEMQLVYSTAPNRLG